MERQVCGRSYKITQDLKIKNKASKRERLSQGWDRKVETKASQEEKIWGSYKALVQPSNTNIANNTEMLAGCHKVAANMTE